MQIDTSVSEADVGSIQTGQPVRFTVDSFREQDFNAKVRMVRLNPTSQQNVVTYNVVIDVDNKDGILLPGMTAQVSIMTNRKDNVVRVPAAALRFRPPESAATPSPTGPQSGSPSGRPSAGAPKVYQVTPSGGLAAKEVKIGISDGRFTEVLEGLVVGEEVVSRLASTAATGQTSGFRFRMF
jgi:HlyD family secretion protein